MPSKRNTVKYTIAQGRVSIPSKSTENGDLSKKEFLRFTEQTKMFRGDIEVCLGHRVAESKGLRNITHAEYLTKRTTRESNVHELE